MQTSSDMRLCMETFANIFIFNSNWHYLAYSVLHVCFSVHLRKYLVSAKCDLWYIFTVYVILPEAKALVSNSDWGIMILKNQKYFSHSLFFMWNILYLVSMEFSETQRCINPTCFIGAVLCVLYVWPHSINLLKSHRQQFHVVQKKEHLFLPLTWIYFHA